jgi:hypothetical protein
MGWLLFLCFVLWPWSGRLCETLTKQGASPRLAQLQRSGLLGLRRVVPRVHVAEHLLCAGTCGSPDSFGAGGVGFRLGTGSVTRRHRIWGGARKVSESFLGTQAEQEHRRTSAPQTREYGGGPGKMRLTPGLDPPPGAFCRRSTASCAACSSAHGSVSKRDLP